MRTDLTQWQCDKCGATETLPRNNVPMQSGKPSWIWVSEAQEILHLCDACGSRVKFGLAAGRLGG